MDNKAETLTEYFPYEYIQGVPNKNIFSTTICGTEGTFFWDTPYKNKIILMVQKSWKYLV